jgi:hypothetical protein
MIKKTVFILLVFTSSLTFANELFPSVENWNLKEEVKEFNSDNLWELINGAADMYFRYNFESLLFGVYESDKAEEINVYIYKQADPASAFGIYTQERGDAFTNNGIGTEGYTIDEAVIFLKGQYYVKLYSNNEGTVESILEIAQKISENIPGEAILPAELELLPQENQVKHSASYVPKEFLGYGFMPAAFVADYNTENEKYQVFILSLNSKEDCIQTIDKYLAFAKQSIDYKENTPIEIADKYNGSVFILWRDNQLFGITGTIANPNQILESL